MNGAWLAGAALINGKVAILMISNLNPDMTAGLEAVKPLEAWWSYPGACARYWRLDMVMRAWGGSDVMGFDDASQFNTCSMSILEKKAIKIAIKSLLCCSSNGSEQNRREKVRSLKTERSFGAFKLHQACDYGLSGSRPGIIAAPPPR